MVVLNSRIDGRERGEHFVVRWHGTFRVEFCRYNLVAWYITQPLTMPLHTLESILLRRLHSQRQLTLIAERLVVDVVSGVYCSMVACM